MALGSENWQFFSVALRQKIGVVLGHHYRLVVPGNHEPDLEVTECFVLYVIVGRDLMRWYALSTSTVVTEQK